MEKTFQTSLAPVSHWLVVFQLWSHEILFWTSVNSDRPEEWGSPVFLHQVWTDEQPTISLQCYVIYVIILLLLSYSQSHTPHPSSNEVRIIWTHEHHVKPCLVTLRCQSCDILQDLCHPSEGAVCSFIGLLPSRMSLFILYHHFLNYQQLVMTINPPIKWLVWSDAFTN